MVDRSNDTGARRGGPVAALVAAGFPRPMAILFIAVMVVVVTAAIALVVGIALALLSGGYGP